MSEIKGEGGLHLTSPQSHTVGGSSIADSSHPGGKIVMKVKAVAYRHPGLHHYSLQAGHHLQLWMSAPTGRLGEGFQLGCQ